jgi:Tol biopolymer transport system component/DNA-binding winged helix-turn-helix (wHTH) protein
MNAMSKVFDSGFLAGDWVVQPELNSLSKDGLEHHVEPKVMSVLLVLAEHPNHVVAKEDLIAAVWQGTFVGDDVLTRCISILRRITEDDPHSPHFIQTVPKVGYRLVAPVSLPAADATTGSAPSFEPAPPQPSIIAGPAPGPQSKRPLPARSWTLAALAILILGSLAAAWRYRQATIKSTDVLGASRVVQFTSSAGEQTQPTFSPDGSHIAFVQTSEAGSSRQIYIKKIGSETMLPLVPGADAQFSPAWSPTGKQIAYLSRSPNGLGLYVVDIGADFRASGAARKVFIPQQPSHWEQGALSWSPDARSLIFPDHSGSQPNSSIFQLDLQSLDAHSITSPPPGWEGDLNPSWSPDGKKIAFTRASETAVRDIYWVSTTNGKLHQLTYDHTNIDSLTWSADSASVIFSSNRAGKYALWKMDLDRSTPERLGVGTEDADQPAVGPVPGQLAYTQGSAIWSIVRVDIPPGKGAAVETTVLSSTQQDSAPSLSPDGRFFAMQSLRSGSQEIWVSSISGDSLRQLTFFGGPLTGSPSWSHLGNNILFDSRPDTHSHIFVVPASGGATRQLTFGNSNDIVPRWSHDDRTIYFRSNRGGRWQVWKMPAAGGQAQPVTNADGIVPQESGDGAYLYYTRGDEDGLWRISTAASHETRVLQQPAAGYWGYWQLTPWGLFYLDHEQGAFSIKVLDIGTGRSTTVATLKQPPGLYSGLSVADEGHTILVTEERNADRHITLAESTQKR